MLAILFSCLGYGFMPILAKLALAEGIEVLPILAWRFGIGAGLVWLMVFSTGRSLPARSQVAGLMGLGVLYASNATSYLLGLTRVSASLASMVFFTYPIVTVLLSRIWIGEPLTRRRVVALGLATAGCALTVGDTGLGSGTAWGVSLILFGVFLLAVFMIKSHEIFNRLPAISGTATMLTTAAIIVTTAAFITGEGYVPMETRPILLLGAMGLISTAIPITLFILGIRWIGPARAALFSTVEPAVTLALAALVLNDRLSVVQWLGITFIVMGVIWLRLEKPGMTGSRKSQSR